jgi:hypothetical protein
VRGAAEVSGSRSVRHQFTAHHSCHFHAISDKLVVTTSTEVAGCWCLVASGLAKRRGGLPSPEDTNRVCPSDWRAGLATWQTAPHDWRAGLALARSFPREGARGKDILAKSQPLVIYDVKDEKYFANCGLKLAKWQRTPAYPCLFRVSSVAAKLERPRAT